MSVSVDASTAVEEVHEVFSSVDRQQQTRIAIQPELAAALASLAEATRIASHPIPPLPAQGPFAQLEEDYQRGLSPIHEVCENWRL